MFINRALALLGSGFQGLGQVGSSDAEQSALLPDQLLRRLQRHLPAAVLHRPDPRFDGLRVDHRHPAERCESVDRSDGAHRRRHGRARSALPLLLLLSRLRPALLARPRAEYIFQLHFWVNFC